MSLCQSTNEVPDAAPALGADAAFATPRRGRKCKGRPAMCATRNRAVRGAHSRCVVEPCSLRRPRTVSPVARRPLRRRERL